MNSILICFIVLFISTIALAQDCRNGAIGCSTDLQCQTYTSPSSYCMNYLPHTYPYDCHGCSDGTGCCSLTSSHSSTPPSLGNCFHHKDCRNTPFRTDISLTLCLSLNGESILIAGVCINL